MTIIYIGATAGVALACLRLFVKALAAFTEEPKRLDNVRELKEFRGKRSK